MNIKVLVIIPAYNEEGSIEKTVQAVQDKAPACDILVVNDGSVDKTLSILQKRRINYLNLRTNLGIGAAVQSGYLYAAENGYTYAVQIDGDGQHDPAYILPMLEWMKKEGLDLGIGSRFIERTGFQSSPLRRVGIRFLSHLLHAVCGSEVRDVTSGYRIVSRRFIELFSEEYPDDYPEPESIVAVLRAGGRIGEYPVIMNERQTGISSISTWNSVYYMFKVSMAILMYKMMHR